MNSISKLLAFSAGFFVGGLITGMLISPKTGTDTRKDIADKSKAAGDWIEGTGKKLSEEASKKASKVKDTLPDLYEATKDLDLKDEDLM